MQETTLFGVIMKLKEKIKMYTLGYCVGIGLAVLFLIAIFS